MNDDYVGFKLFRDPGPGTQVTKKNVTNDTTIVSLGIQSVLIAFLPLVFFLFCLFAAFGLCSKRVF